MMKITLPAYRGVLRIRRLERIPKQRRGKVAGSSSEGHNDEPRYRNHQGNFVQLEHTTNFASYVCRQVLPRPVVELGPSLTAA